jgi:hypothetical protein
LRNRCNNPRNKSYPHYGGRGITVCPQWDSYEQFAADVGPHPGRGLTLDRIVTSKGYEPGNVRWATRKVQTRNRTTTRLNYALADQIRQECLNDRQGVVAKRYGITQEMVSRIVTGGRWA